MMKILVQVFLTMVESFGKSGRHFFGEIHWMDRAAQSRHRNRIRLHGVLNNCTFLPTGRMYGWQGFEYSLGDGTMENRPYAYWPLDQVHGFNIGEFRLHL